MADQKYLVYNNGVPQIITVPDGQTPPPGAILASGVNQAPGALPTPTPGPTSSGSSTPLTSTSGIDPSLFGAAASSTTGAQSFRNIKIPVWRDVEHQVASILPHSDSSANAAEQGMNPHGKDASANALESPAATQDRSNVVMTPQMFLEKEAYNQFSEILMDPTKFRQWADVAVKSGLIQPAQATDAVSLQKVWQDMVKFSVDLKQTKGVDMTPFEVAKMIGENSGAAMLAHQNYVRDHLTGTRVQNDSTIDEKTPSVTTLHDLLGRDPSSSELAAYNHGVEQTAAAHPVNREIQTHYVEGQPDSQKVTYTGGYDAQQAETQAAQAASPEVAQNQAATTFYNALVAALKPAA